MMPRRPLKSFQQNLARRDGWPCADDEYAVNLTPGHGPGGRYPDPIRACVRTVDQAADLVRERTGEIGSTEWYSGYPLGDLRANEVGPFPVGRRAGDVVDRTGVLIGRVSYNGGVAEGPDGKVVWERPLPPPRPSTSLDRALEWISWLNSGSGFDRRRNRVWRMPTTPPPPLDVEARADVEATFGLARCRRIEALLAGKQVRGVHEDF